MLHVEPMNQVTDGCDEKDYDGRFLMKNECDEFLEKMYLQKTMTTKDLFLKMT